MVMVRLVWATPQGDEQIVRIARVSSPGNEGNLATGPRLLRYLVRHRHWSPFEMASACVEIDGVSRTVSRQMLRHRSFTFQEFSQRYAPTLLLSADDFPTMRVAGATNRQSSVPPVTEEEKKACEGAASAFTKHVEASEALYRRAILSGVAPECARAILPEGYTRTRLYMSGTIRSWLHYLDLRLGEGTQEEHRTVAAAIRTVLETAFPMTFDAWDSEAI